jgi:hypothetical protein
MAQAGSVQGPRYIRVVRVPPGEAPLWVREKWVGLELPLARGESGPRHVLTSGVVSGPRNRFAALWRALLGRLPDKAGYAVYVIDALAVLEQSAPDAVEWWRTNAPHLVNRKRKFLFQQEVCELIDEPAV